MPTTIYGTFPMLAPGTTESVSRNGLKKTSGTILFLPGQEAEALDLAQSKGSVFPDAQIRTTDMGVLEMTFDAYQDTGQQSAVFGVEVLNLTKSFELTTSAATPITHNWTITEIWLADSYTVSKVLSASLPSVFLQVTTPNLTSRMIERRVSGNRPSSGDRSLTLTWQPQVYSVSRRNFGTLDEVDIVTSLSAIIA